MSTITQKVPRYLGGVSDQPDELKLPGQLRVAQNVLPDVTLGLLKRPGSRFTTNLFGAEDEGVGKWFHIHKTNSTTGIEQYVGQVTRDGKVRVWDAFTGKRMNVCYTNNMLELGDIGRSSAYGHRLQDIAPGSIIKYCTEDDYLGYLTHDADEELHVSTINDYTFLTNRTVTVSMSGSIADKRGPEAYVEIKQLAAQYSYAFFLSDFVPDGTKKEAYYLSVQPKDWATIQPGECPLNNVQQTFIGVGDGESTGVDCEFTITTVCQTIPRPDGTFKSAYSSSVELINGGDGWEPGDTITVTMDGKDYIVTVEETLETRESRDLGTISYGAASAPPDVETIQNTWINQIDALNAGFKTEKIGQGLYIYRDELFQLTPGDPLLVGAICNQEELDDPDNLIASVNNVSELPSTCKNGMVARVANSFNDQDDYYVKFFANSGIDGAGYWEEVAKPGLQHTINGNTMPHSMIRLADTERDEDGDLIVNFLVGPNKWTPREAGDELTNPRPSFCPTEGNEFGKTINSSIWFRNRLVLLSDENVVMSKAGDYFNLFGKTAMTVTDDDPIDIAVSSNRPSVIYAGLSQTAGLVLFGENQQYLMVNDTDVLSPETAKIIAISNYNYDPRINPFSLGTTIGFFSSTGRDSRFYEMANLSRDNLPEIVENSKVVGSLLPQDLTLEAHSSNNSLILAGTQGSKDVWCYRYFNTGDKRAISAWFNWTAPAPLLYHFCVNDYYYQVMRNNGEVMLTRTDLIPQRNTAEIADEYRISLDCYRGATPIYDPATRKSTFLNEVPPIDGKTLVVYGAIGDRVGSYQPAVIDGDNVVLDGDWSYTIVAYGYVFDMKIELPTIYVTATADNKTTSDTNSYLTVSRVKLNMGDIGVCETTMKRVGKPDYTELIESTPKDAYLADSVAILDKKTIVMPVYEKNENVDITISSSHPTPFLLTSMEWEGNTTKMFYTRV